MLVEQAPIAWQDISGAWVPVTVRYLIGQDQQVGFALGSYDRSQPLTIDPTLTYSSYLGGADQEEGHGIALDRLGQIYVVGTTRSSNFPTTDLFQPDCNIDGWGCRDVFVTKLNASGSAAVYSTYIGGSLGDEGYGIAVDRTGHAYVTGYTSGSNFPTRPGAWQQLCASSCVGEDGFVLKLRPDGSDLVYSTRLGGQDGVRALAIAIDATGAAYVTGSAWTEAKDFPPSPSAPQPIGGGDTDAFVAKLNPSGSDLVYATYLVEPGKRKAAASPWMRPGMPM